MNKLKLLQWTVPLLLISCSTGSASAETNNPLSVAPQGLEFSAEPGQGSFNILCKGEWNIEQQAEWIGLTQLSGSGNAEIGIAVLENSGSEDRNSTLRIERLYGGNSGVSGVNITQKGRKSTFGITPQTKTADPQGETFILRITSESEWDLSIPEDAAPWLLEKERSENTVTLEAKINRDQKRSAAVGFRAKGGKQKIECIVTQEKFAGKSESMSWRNVALSMPEEWYGTNEALDIAENVLLYQREIGGWPKNIEIHHFLTESEKRRIVSEKGNTDAVFDNDATTIEMQFLAKVYACVENECFRNSFNRGLDFILKAQYGPAYKGEGGWPMFYPLRGRAYYDRITFNDNAITNLLAVLKAIYTETPLYEEIVSHDMAAKAKIAYNKGIRCILNCQIVKNGIRTVWCAQHDENTLEPAYGRPFEHPSFSGCETIGIIRTLMAVDNPSDEVKQAVQAAMEWLDCHRIRDKQMQNIVDANGNRDRIIVDAPGKDMWARFYHLESEVPIFGDYVTPPVILYDMFDVPQQRRAGYQFYGNWPDMLFKKEYPAWKQKHGL
ncbi:pectate lyase [Alistipes provencensis]|uniref:pectate lyase n=1 Tax=Alistipes provencensis TaxID=1816676 RepID=UPI0007ECA1C8|nr:pectate lyase [Alistipes provencensis]